jgi:hypothetical protein
MVDAEGKAATPPAVGTVLDIPAEHVAEENCELKEFLVDDESSKNFGRTFKCHWIKW